MQTNVLNYIRKFTQLNYDTFVSQHKKNKILPQLTLFLLQFTSVLLLFMLKRLVTLEGSPFEVILQGQLSYIVFNYRNNRAFRRYEQIFEIFRYYYKSSETVTRGYINYVSFRIKY